MNTPARTIGRGRYIPALFNLGDLSIVNLLFWATTLVFPQIGVDVVSMRELWLCLNVSYIPALYLAHRRPHESRAIRMEVVMKRTLLAIAIHFGLFLSLNAFLSIRVIPAQAFVFYYLLLSLLLLLFDLSGNYALKIYRRRGYNYTRIVIIGTGSTAMRLAEAMQHDPGFGYAVLGFFDKTPAPKFNGKYLGDISQLRSFMDSHDVRQIFYTLSGHDESLAEIIKIADDHVSEFYYVPQIPKTVARGFELYNIGAMPVLSQCHNPLQSSFNRGVKRTFDLLVSGCFLLVFPLIYIPVAIAIKRSSPGPIFFRQERTGLHGKTFECLKFRTMKVNATSDSAQATKDDPRKTRIGDILRRTSIDELPQFINVFKGDMSVVGPRPHMLKHTEEYTRLVDRYMARHAVKPGITGWAQVNGYRGITDELWKMEKRVECDVWYIENWSLLLDIKIMCRTIINALAGEKNAF